MHEELLARLGRHDRLALSRLLTLLARGEAGDEVLAGLPRSQKVSRVVAITGSGGVGKSSLIGKLIEIFRRRTLTVAVLACDPESPLSGGALLGDRFRMPSKADDDGVFIRSLAAASGQGAVAQNLAALVRLLETFGFDLIVLETVGAGQGDTAVRELADVVVLLLQPETGDDLQWEKAGLIEVADIVAIHKADLPGADSAAAQVRGALELAGDRPVPVLKASARTGAGIDELVEAILSSPLHRSAPPAGKELLRLGQQALAKGFRAAVAADDANLKQLFEGWQSGRLDAATAGDAVLKLLAKARSGNQ